MMRKIALGTVAIGLGIAASARTQPLGSTADWHQDAPGVRHRVTIPDLVPPLTTPPATNIPKTVSRPAGARLAVPKGFTVAPFFTGLAMPRIMRFAPNGDLFVAESSAGRIRILRMGEDPTRPDSSSTFATGLFMPFGIGFWPPGPDPRFVYVTTWNAVVRFPYRRGDLKARGPAQVVIPNLPTEGHWTRDIAFSPDGKRLFLSVGSLSNHGESMSGVTVMTPLDAASVHAIEQRDGTGAAWGAERGRATVLESDPDGNGIKHYANGLRNCVSLVLTPGGSDLWCTVNERDQLGDDLPPDFLTRLVPQGFYGWPWFYIGDHEDPIHRGERPDLTAQVIVPDVLFQPHSAPLVMTFYEGHQFPPSYRGSIFVAMHGSYNRSRRTGSKVVRVLMQNGKPTGEYEDFLTGFTATDTSVWGRPVGVTVTPDGALLVSDDAGGTIWRVSYHG